jgi:natural product biosynthesis luciferase-like monooxygenase protein
LGFSCLLQGNDTLTIHCGGMLAEAGHRIAAVITRERRVRDWALSNGLATFEPGAALEAEADWFLSVANTEVIPDNVLARGRKGAINFHDGPLPRYAGLNAPVWALLNGEKTHGVTWHVIENGIDEGRIVAQRTFDIAPEDTALTLNARCFAAAIDCFGEVMAAVDAGLPMAMPQDLSLRSYFGLRDRPRAGAVLDFSRPAQEILRLVRALDHGDYRNPLAMPKLVTGGRTILVRGAERAEGSAAPGTVLAADTSSVTVAAQSGAVKLTGLSDAMGAPAGAGLAPGVRIARPDLERIDAALKAAIPGERAWEKRFHDYRPAIWCAPTEMEGTARFAVTGARERLAPAFAAAVSALSEYQPVDLALAAEGLPGALLGWRPFRFDATRPWGEACEALKEEIAAAMPGIPFDLPARIPELARRAMPDAALSAAGPVQGAALTLALDEGALHADLARISRAEAELIAARISHLASAEVADATPVSELPILPETERRMLLVDWNATDAEYARDICIHAHFEAQADRTPDAPALAYNDVELTYAELDRRANRLSHVLRSMGVGPGMPVGLHVRRSAELLVGALGILKAGGAYLPLDPAYPTDRIALYMEDSGTGVVVSESALPLDTNAQVLNIDTDPRLADAPDTRVESEVMASDLAYMIYTSGSTGRPKGVMVEHRNVSNFFTGMDARIQHRPGSVLLAVTSLSFDISVLELFWTLARGFKVVVSGEEKLAAGASAPAPNGKMDFSLFYWGNDDGVGRDRYGMLLDGARFADENGFCAVWTPERHFHAFGGLYPNPSVTGAAVAAVTRNIGVRAGSCVAPLHHPARIAEEWAVIDNLTNGRAGLAMASGWQPDDFVLRPENSPPNNKQALFDAIEDVRKLWRGEEIQCAKADGNTVARLTQPRPVSKELPVWVTTAGNPDTWKQAGEIGAHVLTHLLGQTIEEVGEKIRIYHEALRAAGRDPKDFTVTLMLHTFLAADRETAREIAREPMKTYLRSAADLIKQYAWAFPAFRKPQGVDSARQLDLGSLEKEELEAILDFAFERYFERSGLFGTIEDAMDRVAEVRAIGVTEIACLIDYGIERRTVLDALKPLAQVVKLANAGAAEADYSIAASIARHGVTHMQCTPYMARMLVANEESRAALGKLNCLMIGGEPLSPGLVHDLASATSATIENMYGPTETTIWSSTDTVRPGEAVRIGKPIANTQVYVLDEAMEPCPVGVTGELHIAGEGVAGGYHGRGDLTAERFLSDPFRPGNRMFRTGDLARWNADGRLEFLGRRDAQVKIRGYRIELGEIEAALEAQPGVTQAVVIVRNDASDVGQLTGYITGTADEGALRAALAERLPAFMVPNRIATLAAFPLTPNRKIDRKALSAPVQPAKPAAPSPALAPAATVTAAELDAGKTIAAVWREVLNVEKVAPTDNFFDLGGHSLLAVEAHRAVRHRLGLPQLSIADIFRSPTLAGFTARAEALMKPTTPAPAANTTATENASAAIDRRRALRHARERQH